MNLEYKKKYLKYKKKYLILKSYGGSSQIEQKTKSDINNEKFSKYFLDDLEIKTDKDSIHIGIPIPKYEYTKADDDTIDELVKNDYNDYNDNDKELIKKFFKLIRHVSFKEFYGAIKNKTNEFNELIGNEKFILIVNEGMQFRKYEKNLENLKEKSNYWISKLVYLNLDVKPKIILDYGKNKIISDSMYTLSDEGNSDTKSINILLCDDMMYSGNQMTQNIYETISTMIEEFEEIKIFNLYLIIPFISSIAFERLKNITLDDIKKNNKWVDILGKSLNITILVEEVIEPLSKQLTEEEYISLYKIFGDKMFRSKEDIKSVKDLPHTAIYFDHKMADYQSSFPLIIPTIIKNCKHLSGNLNDIKPPCPEPPYKSRSSEKSKKRVNLEMLQKI